MEAAIEVRGLRKNFRHRPAVAGVSFTVAPGEIFGLLGPNGSGKTTTVECVQGLRRPDAGSIHVFGLDVLADPRRVRRVVGSQLQESALPDRIRVWEALRLFAAINPGGRPWQQLLDEWGLARQRRTPFGDLSGGERQRLFVALALIAEPRLVVLDEMTTGLDPAARRIAWKLVADVRDRGTTVLLVTHFMDEAQRLCDRLAVLVDGRLVATGTPADLVDSRRAETVVRFTRSRGCAVDYLREVPGVRSVEVLDGGPVEVRGRGPMLARVGHALVEHGAEPADLRADVPTLEDAYLAITGTAPDAEGRP